LTTKENYRRKNKIKRQRGVVKGPPGGILVMVNWRKKVPGNGHNKPTWLFLQIRKSPAMNLL
jgi:hypothetical protein